MLAITQLQSSTKWARGTNEDSAPCSFLFNFVCSLEVQLACYNTQTIGVKEIFLLKNILYFQCALPCLQWEACALLQDPPDISVHWVLRSGWELGHLAGATIPSALCATTYSFGGCCSIQCWCTTVLTCSVLYGYLLCLGLWQWGTVLLSWQLPHGGSWVEALIMRPWHLLWYL